MTKRSEFNFPAIYTITNRITGTTYVGQAECIRVRWATHRRCPRRNINSRNLHLQRAWNKYGEENFIFEIVFRFLSMSREELQFALDEAEIYILREFQDNCYNLMEAGLSGFIASEETLRKLSEHNKKQWQKPEHRAKISKAQKAAWNEPGRKEAHSKKLKESFQDPDYQNRRKQISTEFWAPGGCLRETQSAKRKANWQDPEYIAKQKESRKKAWQDPEIRAKRIAAIKAAKAKKKLVPPPGIEPKGSSNSKFDVLPLHQGGKV